MADPRKAIVEVADWARENNLSPTVMEQINKLARIINDHLGQQKITGTGNVTLPLDKIFGGADGKPDLHT